MTASDPARLYFAGLTLDPAARRLVDAAGREIALRHSEFELLTTFVATPGRALTRDILLEAVAGRRSEPFDRSVDVLVGRLRRKIEPDAKQPQLIITVPGVGYRFDGKPQAKAAEHPALPLPDKPSIAVLPFTNMSDDPDQEYFSDGLAEDIITDLSRSRMLFVIARNSSFAYRGRTSDMKQVARELGVRYLLEGSVRRSGHRVRVSAQLIEAETATHLWAQRFDRELANVFEIQDEITRAVVAGVKPAVADSEQHRALRKHPDSLDAWEACQRGAWHLAQMEPRENLKARDFFQRAIELDETNAPPFKGLFTTYFREARLFYSCTLEDAMKVAEPLAQKAVALDPTDAGGHAALAWVAGMLGDFDIGLARAEQAIVLAPNSASANMVLGNFLTFFGRASEGCQHLLTSLRLNPRDPRNWGTLSGLAVTRYALRDYSGSVEMATRGLQIAPKYFRLYRLLAAALGQLGRETDAREVMQTAATQCPPLARQQPPFLREEEHQHLLDGLHKAGLT